MTLRQRYFELCNTPSDIFEHLPTLHQYACDCEHITEFGTRHGVSTVALMVSRPLTVHTYDIAPQPDIEQLKAWGGVHFHFHCKDTKEVATRIEPTDLLFIDTWHAACQLEVELQAAQHVNKYLIFHDTVSFGHSDEPGPPGHVDGGGLLPVIERFLDTHPEWRVDRHDLNCNGLLVLRRV